MGASESAAREDWYAGLRQSPKPRVIWRAPEPASSIS